MAHNAFFNFPQNVCLNKKKYMWHVRAYESGRQAAAHSMGLYIYCKMNETLDKICPASVRSAYMHQSRDAYVHRP